MADIVLSRARSSTLLQLRAGESFAERVSGRPGNGSKATAPVDGAVKFFQSTGLVDQGAGLVGRKEAIDQGIDAFKAALGATDSARDLITQIKGKFSPAADRAEGQRGGYARRLSDLNEQINSLFRDTNLKGLDPQTTKGMGLAVRFTEVKISFLEIEGVNLNLAPFHVDKNGVSLADGDSARALERLLSRSKMTGASALNKGKGDYDAGLVFTALMALLALDQDRGKNSKAKMITAEQLDALKKFRDSLDPVADADLIAVLDQLFLSIKDEGSGENRTISLATKRPPPLNSMQLEVVARALESLFWDYLVQNHLRFSAEDLYQEIIAGKNKEGVDQLASRARQSLGDQDLSVADPFEPAVRSLFESPNPSRTA